MSIKFVFDFEIGPLDLLGSYSIYRSAGHEVVGIRMQTAMALQGEIIVALLSKAGTLSPVKESGLLLLANEAQLKL